MPITLGLSLSLSGEYAAMGRQAEAALRLLVNDINGSGGVRVDGIRAELLLDLRDDASDRARCSEIYRSLCFDKRCELILGPYSSKLVEVAAPIAEEAGRVFINHGGAADDLHDRGYRMIVSVLSPASEYMRGFVRLLASLKFRRKRLAIVAANTPFARAILRGIERTAQERAMRRRHVRVRVKWDGRFDAHSSPEALLPVLRRNRINALVSAGSYSYDLAVMRAMVAAHVNIPVLACVAAGVANFHADLGEDADGIVGPSQWEPEADITPEMGPSPRDFERRMRIEAGIANCDYVAAQAYAAGVLARTALELAGQDQSSIREAFSSLRTTTLFGNFAIDPTTGIQVGHRTLLVQWHDGHKVIVEPGLPENEGALEFPPGWKLIAAGFEMLRLSRPESEVDDDEEGGDRS